MFANIRHAFNNATEDVSQRLDQNRWRRRGNQRSASSSTRSRSNQPQEPPASTQRVPPASVKAIKQLPTIRVAPEDLVDPNNRECCVCLDDNELDDKVTRLPCAHIFHTCCIIDWLSNHSCTCPVCRYELPTDDPQYESGRIQRMKSRKPRYAMHELKRMSISDLLELNRRPVSGVLEKEDLIKFLIDENWIDVIPSPEPVAYKLEMLRKMKIRELKRTMAEAGVFFRRQDVLMKSDMITLFENSGRLILIRSESDTCTSALDNYETIINSRTDKDQLNSPKLLSDLDIEMGSTTFEEKDQVLVETVKEDSLDLEGVVSENEAMDEERVRSTIVMFPNQNEELVEESKEYETKNDFTNMISALPNMQNPSLSNIHTQDNLLNPNSAISDIQNPVLVEILPLQHASTENITVGERILDSDEIQYDCSSGSDMKPNARGLGQTDIHDDNLSATTGLFHTNIDPRSTFQHYTILHLQTLGRDLRIDLSHCLEREEMIDILVNAGATGNPDPSALSSLMLSSWSVSQLRVVASEIKIDLSECTTKDEMIESMLYAGNVERPYLRDYLRSLSPLTTKPLPDLRAIARKFKINISDCLEKDEIIQRLISRDQRVDSN